MKHASIVPLIGGETIGSEQAFGNRPDYLLSYSAFKANDSHLVNWYGGDVPYVLLDEGGRHPHKVDVVSSVCPCAGLSQMSFGYGDKNKNNDWMPIVAKYVLGEMKPEVYWGENAPGFAGKIGQNVRENLRQIGLENGYSMSVYTTQSLNHGLPQVRRRAFYFFWKGDRVPLLNYFHKPRPSIEEVILGAKGNSQRDPINSKVPSRDDPYYRYILEDMCGGIDHRTFARQIEPAVARGNDVLTYIERNGRDYFQVAEWMKKNGYDREVEKCIRRAKKLAEGGNVMRRGTVIPKDFIGAFVAHYPYSLTHPVEDRYINYREAMTIMGLPDNFELLGANQKVANHICQNVPVNTARDMALEVRAYLEGKRETVNSEYVHQSNLSDDHEIMDKSGGSIEEIFA